MQFDITIRQILEGHVKIEADTLEQALKAAEQKYVLEGAELPDMDDVNPLQFSCEDMFQARVQPPVVEGTLTKEAVETYLIFQGYPHPRQDQIDDFLVPCEEHPMYEEAVRNNYALCDVDRWFHLKNVLSTPLSFPAAMLVDDALWEEEYETMEMNKPEDILNTPEEICKDRIKEVIEDFAANEAKAAEKWATRKLTKEDAAMFDKVFGPNLDRKQPLSTLIESADSRTAGNTVGKEEPAKNAGLDR